MLFKRKYFIFPALFSSALLLSACNNESDEEVKVTEKSDADSICIENAKEVTVSDGRSLCIGLTAFKAEAPFMAGFMAPGKTTHTVFVSDSDGNPVNVTNDEVVTAISQYPMMYMNAGHTHSAPFKHADTSAAEYGAYNFDIYYPMASTMMDGTSRGRWEYRVMISDNNGTADDDTDDKMHKVIFEPAVEMYMIEKKAFRAVGKNESDKYKNPMGMTPTRQYSAWLETIGKVSEGAADVKLYLTTQDMDHSSMAMTKPMSRSAEHGNGDMHVMGDKDSHTYPAIHAPMDMMGDTVTVTLHSEDGTTEVEIDSASVEVSTDDGENWTTLAAGMTHEEMGYYSGPVPMEAGEVTMLVKVTVNGNVMTKTGVTADGMDAEDIPALKFTASE